MPHNVIMRESLAGIFAGLDVAGKLALYQRDGNDGATAVVLAPNGTDLARPHVRVILSASGERLAQDKPLEYRPLPAERSVRRALKAEEYPMADEERAA